METTGSSFTTQKLVAEFCNSEFAPRSRGFLVLYAAEVVYIARMCRSTRLTAAFFSKKFGRKFSRRPIEDILAKVKNGKIVVTPEQLAEVAAEHPMAQHYAQSLPDILNPAAKVKIEDATPAKKSAKKAAKKAAKKSPPKKSKKKATKAPGDKPVEEPPKDPDEMPASDPPEKEPDPTDKGAKQLGDSLNEADSPTEAPESDPVSDDAHEDASPSGEFLSELDAELKKAGLPID